MTPRAVQEPIDAGPGRPPLIRAEDDRVISFEFSILGGEMRDDKRFVPTPRTRLHIRCDRDGEITLRILEGKSSSC